MKNIIFGILVVFFAFLSCRNDDDDLQKIDQILTIYMKSSSGQDLLNPNKSGSYISYTVNDVFGTTDNAPVSIPLKLSSDSLYYMEYIAGAKRITDDSLSDTRTYRSRMALALRRTVNSVTDTINDTLDIEYRWTSSVFEVSKVYYNKQLQFTKEPGGSNVVTIVK